MGKMGDAQSLCVATSATTSWATRGIDFRVCVWHSIALVAIVGIIRDGVCLRVSTFVPAWFDVQLLNEQAVAGARWEGGNREGGEDTKGMWWGGGKGGQKEGEEKDARGEEERKVKGKRRGEGNRGEAREKIPTG